MRRTWASGWDIDRLVTGRMTRRGYWLRAILIGIVVCVPVTACTVLCCGPSLDAAQLMKMTSVTSSLNPVLVQCLLFPTVVRRLHDMGRSSLLARIQFALVLPTLLGGISPLVALIASVLAFVPLTILGLCVSFWPGTPDRNAYGPNPRDPDAGGRNAEAAPGSQAEAKWLPLVRRLFQGLCFCAALLLFAACVVLQIRISRAYARDLAAHEAPEAGESRPGHGARSEYVVPDSYIYRGPSTSGRSPKDPDAKVDWSAFDAPGGKTSGR